MVPFSAVSRSEIFFGGGNCPGAAQSPGGLSLLREQLGVFARSRRTAWERTPPPLPPPTSSPAVASGTVV